MRRIESGMLKILSSTQGALSDRVTQRWVQATGKKIRLEDSPWLEGPIAPPEGIGRDYFERLATAAGLEIATTDSPLGLMEHFHTLAGPMFDPRKVQIEVARFYEQTSAYSMDAW